MNFREEKTDEREPTREMKKMNFWKENTFQVLALVVAVTVMLWGDGLLKQVDTSKEKSLTGTNSAGIDWEYIGEVKNDNVKHGKGTVAWSNGDVYEGDFVNDYCTGKGKYTWSNGNVYEGDWVNGERTGKGIFTWSNGDVYEGDFVRGKITGKGKCTWSNGDVYEGDFVDNERHGYGKCTYSDGRVEEGNWENNRFIKD